MAIDHLAGQKMKPGINLRFTFESRYADTLILDRSGDI